MLFKRGRRFSNRFVRRLNLWVVGNWGQSLCTQLPKKKEGVKNEQPKNKNGSGA